MTEIGCVSESSALVDGDRAAMISVEDGNEDKEGEDEEDEEEDVDFNPFLKGSPSPEASSSLSSEIVGDSEHGEEEITTKTTISPEGRIEKEDGRQQNILRRSKKRRKVSMSQSKVDMVREKENGSTSSGIDVSEAMARELNNTRFSQTPVLDSDDEDAICRRTRARYSLASFTLDELEAFLQESDDDDDLQNVDDEEEYRKFLAAVLQGGDCDGQSSQGHENIDDEDEDNDADFEIELEEMLESDYDEGIADKAQKEEIVRARRRPETRQNKRQRASVLYKNKLIEQSKRPLRPLLPVLPSGQPASSFPVVRGKSFAAGTAPGGLSSAAQDIFINGFAPHQIGQLHCLIHEHVQLLIQIFSLCILDPSKQHIASQVQGLIFEMLHKRNEVIAHRSEPYPDAYFRPPYICPSVPDALSRVQTAKSTCERSSSFDASGAPPLNTQVLAFQSHKESNVGTNGHVVSTEPVQVSFWVPSVGGPVLSVLDVAPLNLVGKYMDDVNTGMSLRQNLMLQNSLYCLIVDLWTFFFLPQL